MAVFVAFAAVVLLLEATANEASIAADRWQMMWSILAAVLIALMAWFPAGAGSAFCVLVVADTIMAPSEGVLLFPVMGLYAILADWISRRWYWQAAVAFLAVDGAVLLRSSTISADLVGIAIGLAGAVGLGFGIQVLDRRMRAMHSRIEVARQEVIDAERSVRQDIAASLHDTVARDLSGIIVTSDVALARCTDHALGDQLQTINSSARASLRRVRALIGGLRSSDPNVSLAEVIHTCRVMLQVCEVSLNSELPAELDQQLTQRQRSLLALAIREGTSNILKYAQPGSSANLLLEGLPDRAVALTIVSDVPAAQRLDPRPAELSGGFGLANLASRVSDVAGSIDFGRSGGRWVLSVTVPAGAGVDPE
ncbi:histidine kinase [Actinomyces sp. F1_1611]